MKENIETDGILGECYKRCNYNYCVNLLVEGDGILEKSTDKLAKKKLSNICALKKLYGYASEEEGIRHEGLESV